MPVRFVEDKFGFQLAVGTRVSAKEFSRSSSVADGTVVGRDHPEYIKAEFNDSLEFIPVMHDDGRINGYFVESHLDRIEPPQIVVKAWLDNEIPTATMWA